MRLCVLEVRKEVEEGAVRRIWLPPAAWLTTAMVAVAALACILLRTRSSQRLLALLSLPRPSVMLSPTMAKALLFKGA